MPHNQNRENKDFSRFDTMSDSELQQLLQEDMNTPEGQDTDYEMLLYIMEVLAKRKESRNEFNKTPDEAFVSFRQHYLPLAEEAHEAETSAKKPRRLLRASLSAAAVIAIVFLGSMTASAFGFDIWAIVGKWAQETFHFGSYAETEVSEPSKEDDSGFTTLQETLLSHGITTELAPTQIPEGFKLVDICIDQTPMRKCFLAVYQNNEKLLQISVNEYITDDSLQIERSDSPSETYVYRDQLYYIFSDNDMMTAAWTDSSYECYISGNLSTDEIKTMIESISKEK